MGCTCSSMGDAHTFFDGGAVHYIFGPQARSLILLPGDLKLNCTEIIKLLIYEEYYKHIFMLSPKHNLPKMSVCHPGFS